MGQAGWGGHAQGRREVVAVPMEQVRQGGCAQGWRDGVAVSTGLGCGVWTFLTPMTR